jgi:hypothetical protein
MALAERRCSAAPFFLLSGPGLSLFSMIASPFFFSFAIR